MKFKLFRFVLTKLSKDKARYFIDFIVFGIGFFMSTGIALCISIIVNKNMTKEELGLYNYNKSLLEFAAYASSLLLYRGYLRFNITGNNISLFNKVKFVNFIAFVFLEILAYYLTRSYWALLFPFFIFYEERLYFFRSLMIVKKVNFLKISSSLLSLSLLLIFLHFNFIEPNFVLFAYGLGFILALLFYFNKKKIKKDFEIITWRKILFYSLPGLGAVIVRLSLDVSSQYLIKSEFDLIELSKYAIATRVLLSIKLFSSLLMMFFPILYFREIKIKNINFINRTRIMSLSLMLLIVILSIIFRNQIYWLMGASDYMEYSYMYSFLVISEFFFVIAGLWGIYLSYALKTHVTLLIYLLGAVFNIIILGLFLPLYGIIVAPLSILTTNIFMATLMFIVSFRMERKFLKSIL
ncbi:hypothetical protein F0365_11180 [Nonlabens sp. Ci31]|jgi:hypothetical protein|uniref:hypothetical protein n=1 Tax=Nonlabens sp. Ci31 TaxID=2608253 RepID=UPI0014641360|nr:hypothetical protein [Nonlabens sp. Ci31]QJP34913.1 hypothetical protein F0365_11180 [Nonlabens sp. Ci31]